MDEAPFAARTAEDLGGAVGEHLVHVHVGLRAGARLPDRERKFAGMLSGKRLVRRGDDRVRLLLVDRPERDIHPRGAALDDQERPNERRRHLLGGDAEVLERALRLCAPEPVRGDFDRSEGVALDARGGAGHRSFSRSTKGARFGPLLRALSQRSCQAPGATGVSAGAEGAAAWAASSAAAFIDSRTRPFSSASSTLTRTTCPSLT